MAPYEVITQEEKKKQESIEENQPFATVVGRLKEDQLIFGTRGVGYIGKHIVGTGEDAHTTTKVLLDLLRPHIILISGKRGTGKSYAAGVIAEELASLPQEFRQNVAVVMVDTMGIFWSMKLPNEKESELLRAWNIKAHGFDNIRVFVPFEQQEEFLNAGIPIDAGISILPYEFSAEEWSLAFNLKRTDPIAISLEKNINELIEGGGKFNVEDIITKIRDDNETSKDVKDALENMLTVAGQWGVFGEQGINIDDIVVPGQISVVDVSRLRATEAWSVRNFLVAILTRKIYQYRVLARKEEEVAKIEGIRSTGKKYPVVWLIIDEAHNFVPSDIETVSSEPILTIAKQGREPGVSMIVITQMPNKIHQEVLSQTDLVISHRLTSRDDIEALHAVMQTYLFEDMWKYINSLPRWPGAAIILDDNLEKIFSVNIRPRLSWHGGGTASIV